jgi:hypothetical protein
MNRGISVYPEESRGTKDNKNELINFDFLESLEWNADSSAFN